MNIIRNAVTVAVIVFFVISGAVSALSEGQTIQGAIMPFVMDISQSVPVEISAPIEMEGGEIVTVTAPITVNVELRVSVDGQGVAQVIESAAQEPFVTISDDGQRKIDSLGIPYSINIDSPDLTLAEWTTYSDTYDQFSISGEVLLDTAAEPIQDVLVVARFYGSEGELVNVEEIVNVGYGLDPGEYNHFDQRTGIQPGEIDHYEVSFRVIR